ncbi:MAG: nuclease-related domain-containing protein [Candidatus Izemoplasmatales bacterium]|jgi:hypothetical protein
MKETTENPHILKGNVMAARRKQVSPIESLVLLLWLIIEAIIILIIRIIKFLYDLITFFASKYKLKSGNNFFKTYFNKGNYGEFVLYRKMIHLLGKESVLTNVYLENKNTDTTEIDVLAVSTKGIYVFEMKNFAGYIYGSDQDQNWTQVLNRWSKHQFYNPLRQNYAHTKAVELFLEISKESIVPMVVFSNRSKLSKIDVKEHHNVFQYKEAVKFVKKNEKKGMDILSLQQKQDFVIRLLDRCNMSEEIKQKHIDDVKALQNKVV